MMKPLTLLSLLVLVSVAIPARKKPIEQKHQFKVGDHVTVSLSAGRVVDATVRAVIEKTDGIHLQVDIGENETALVYLRQVRPTKH